MVLMLHTCHFLAYFSHCFLLIVNCMIFILVKIVLYVAHHDILNITSNNFNSIEFMRYDRSLMKHKTPLELIRIM